MSTNTGTFGSAVNVHGKGMPIIVNGRFRCVAPGPTISYRELCDLAGVSPETQPTVAYSVAGRDGTTLPGCFAPLEDHAVYNVANTGTRRNNRATAQRRKNNARKTI